MTDKVSILICGKLNRTSIENLHNYTKYKEVIICCWRDDNLKILDGIDSFDNVKILSIIDDLKYENETDINKLKEMAWN